VVGDQFEPYFSLIFSFSKHHSSHLDEVLAVDLAHLEERRCPAALLGTRATSLCRNPGSLSLTLFLSFCFYSHILAVDLQSRAGIVRLPRLTRTWNTTLLDLDRGAALSRVIPIYSRCCPFMTFFDLLFLLQRACRWRLLTPRNRAATTAAPGLPSNRHYRRQSCKSRTLFMRRDYPELGCEHCSPGALTSSSRNRAGS